MRTGIERSVVNFLQSNKGSGENNVNNVKILTDYRSCVMELMALEEQYKRLLFLGSPSVNVTAQFSQANAKTNSKDKARIQAQDGVLEMIDRIKAEKIAKINLFESVLNMVEDGEKRTILRYYYGLGFSDMRIATKMGISERNVANKRRDTLAVLKAS